MLLWGVGGGGGGVGSRFSILQGVKWGTPKLEVRGFLISHKMTSGA
jgi:hypothetical protein